MADLVDAISNGNTRELLRYTYNFLTSSFLDTNEILEKLNEDSKYTVPEHHVLRAILFGDFFHYDPQKSVFINLFDLEHAVPLEHFTRITTLQFLGTVSDGHPNYGFCEVDEVCRYLARAGYSPHHASWTVRYLFERKCVESRDPVEEWEQGVRQIRLTALGKYHLTHLCKWFQYVDAVTVDTPILDPKVRMAIKDVKAIDERLARCEHFIGYLNDASRQVIETAMSQVWTSVSDAVRSEIRSIRNSVEQRRARERRDRR